MAIASRIFFTHLKNKKTNQKVKYKAFIPLVNLLLFNRTENPIFGTEIENLGGEYLEANQYLKNIDSQNETYFKKCINNFLKVLDKKNRRVLCGILMDSDLVSNMLMVNNIFNFDKSKSNPTEDFYLELNTFLIEGKIGFYFYLFIKYQVEGIFGYDFSDNKVISKEQYENLIVDLCNPKKPTFN